jgi:hypothetical protein
VKHGCAGEKPIGEALVNEKKADLVAGVLLAACQPLDLAYFFAGQHCPPEDWLHVTLPSVALPARPSDRMSSHLR